MRKAATQTENAPRKGIWRPLLKGVAAKQALEAVEAIAAEIQRRKQSHSLRTGNASGREKRQDASLAGGTAGLAVFYGYLNRAGLFKTSEELACRFLEAAGDAVESVNMDPSLYGGFTGVAWAMAHLEGRLLEPNEEISTGAVDEVLKGYVHRPGWRRDYDLIVGLVGLGVYSLERLPDPLALSCLEGVVDRLEETARHRSKGITWHTPPRLLTREQRKENPRGYFNVGLAHGVPGVVAFLGAACAAGARRKKARKLLDGAVSWLLAQKLPDRPGASFPAWITPGVEPRPCRSAWCYGDPGVAAALSCAARGVGQRAWQAQALDIAAASAQRPPEQAGVVDATLCHGAAGLGHVFNRMYQATGDETLGRAARFWFQRTLAMRRPGRGVEGYAMASKRRDGRRFWVDDAGILTGAAGIALALLAATTSIEPEWDRMLLVSTRRS